MRLTKNRCFLLGVIFDVLLWLLATREELVLVITSFFSA